MFSFVHILNICLQFVPKMYIHSRISVWELTDFAVDEIVINLQLPINEGKSRLIVVRSIRAVLFVFRQNLDNGADIENKTPSLL